MTGLPPAGAWFWMVTQYGVFAERVLDCFDTLTAKEGLAVTEIGMKSFVKTSGSKGLHIYVPLEPRWDSYSVRAAAVALARELERRRPDLVTAAWWKEERGERVFVDFNQNAPHKTVFGSWSVRPRVDGQVSTPIEWTDVPSVVPDELTLATVPSYVARSPTAYTGVCSTPRRFSFS